MFVQITYDPENHEKTPFALQLSLYCFISDSSTNPTEIQGEKQVKMDKGKESKQAGGLLILRQSPW